MCASIYKDNLNLTSSLSFVLLSQNHKNDNKKMDDDHSSAPEKINDDLTKLTNFFNQSNFDEFIITAHAFKDLIISLEDIQSLVLPFKHNNFPELILTILSLNFDQLSEYTYFFLLVLCALDNDDITNFLIQNQILNICFFLIQQQTPHVYNLIDCINLLLSKFQVCELHDIILNIPFESIFANQCAMAPEFTNSIFHLYQTIADYTQDVPKPNLLHGHISKIKECDKICDTVLENLLFFFIKMTEIRNLDFQIFHIFIQEKTIIDFITKSISESDKYYQFAIFFFQFCTLSYKYLKFQAKVAKNHSSCIRLIKQMINNQTCFMAYSEEEEEEYDENDDEPESSAYLAIKRCESILSTIYQLMSYTFSNNKDLAIILNFFKMYMKTNPHALMCKNIKRICLILFSAIREGSFEVKMAANKALSFVIKCGCPEICDFLHENNIYEIFLLGLSIDDTNVLGVVITSIIYFFDKFIFRAEFKEIVAEFATPEFREAVKDVKERSEKWIISMCENLELRIQQIASNEYLDSNCFD